MRAIVLTILAVCLEALAMPNVPVQIPPGMYHNGTDYSAKERWRRGNLVRFFGDDPEPVGGWTPIPLDLDNALPQYMEYDGNDAYSDTFTSSGNLVTVVLGFNIPSFTGTTAEQTLMFVYGTSGGTRVIIKAFASNHATASLRNRLEVIVADSGSNDLVKLYTPTAMADGQDHMLFFSFDGDNGLATFFIDGLDADDPNAPGRLAPSAGTLDAGASTSIFVGASNGSPTTPITGFLGPVGYGDAYLTNWADFMDGNYPREIDESGWDEWDSTQPEYWMLEGTMTANDGAEGNMTAVGSPTLADRMEAVDYFVPGYTRKMVAWRDSDGQRWLGIGTTRGLFAWDGSAAYDVTPSGIGVGEQGAVLGPGYGSGLYGTETYGTARTQVINTLVLEPGAWALDTWGENLVGIPNWQGQLYEWDPSTPSTVAALVSGDAGSGSAESPEANRSLLVTNERHLLLIGAGDWSGSIWTQNPRKLWWCSSEDNTEWTATATNSAGDLELQTDGVAQCGVRWRNENIIWTNVDAHRLSYIGPPNYYGVKAIGAKAGIVSQTGFVTTDNFIFWVGPEGFHVYDGAVTELECDVWDYYIDRLNKANRQQIAVGHNPRFNEVWVFYPSGTSTLNNSYLIWNYQKNHWAFGELGRSAWHEALIWDNPIGAKAHGGNRRSQTFYQSWAHDTAYDVVTQFQAKGEKLYIQPGTFEFLDDDGDSYGTEDTDYQVDYITGEVTTLSGGSFADDEFITASYTLQEQATPRTTLYFHEDGYTDELPGRPVRDAFVETAPFEIGQGDVRTEVRRMYQDTGRQDDLDPVSNSNAVQVEFETREAPEAPKETHGPYAFDNARGYTDIRFSGRQVVMRLRQVKNELWRVGVNRLEIEQGSGR